MRTEIGREFVRERFNLPLEKERRLKFYTRAIELFSRELYNIFELK